jgi:hypothetical protein
MYLLNFKGEGVCRVQLLFVLILFLGIPVVITGIILFVIYVFNKKRKMRAFTFLSVGLFMIVSAIIGGVATSDPAKLHAKSAEKVEVQVTGKDSVEKDRAEINLINNEQDRAVESNIKAEDELEVNDRMPIETAGDQEVKKVQKKKTSIPGLTAADVKINLQNTWKLKFTGPKKLSEMATSWQDQGMVFDSDTNVNLLCIIHEENPYEISYIDFIVDAAPEVGNTSLDVINSVAKSYFGFGATVPYEDASPKEAKKWVADNSDKAITPGVIEENFGSVHYELFGTKYFRTLRLTPQIEQ